MIVVETITFLKENDEEQRENHGRNSAKFWKMPRMLQVLSKDSSALEFLMDPEVSTTDNSKEMLKTLMIT